MLFINISNQIGAGPRNISINLIRALSKLPKQEAITVLATDDPLVKQELWQSNLNYTIVPIYQKPSMKVVRFFYVQLLILWLTINQRCRRALAFGNFFLVGSAARKAVLMHHPYLVDNDLLRQLALGPRILEQVKRLLFRWTLLRVDVVIVQSEYMHEMFRRMYPNYLREVVVIPNPISSNFAGISSAPTHDKATEWASKKTRSLIYASRFYPHKNHVFLVALAREFLARRVAIEIIVTIDPSIPGAHELLTAIANERLPIRNIGEVPQQELINHYRYADAAIFPSRAETFGNPLVEALSMALPVVAPRKGYSLAVLGNSGIYYEEDNLESCVEACRHLFENLDRYKQACDEAYLQGQSFPDISKWCDRMLAAVDG